MLRSTRLISPTAFVAVAIAFALLASSPAMAQATEPTTGTASYTLYEAKWEQPTVSIWSNWSAATCTGAYSNPTGDPTPPLSPREMRGILRAVVAHLNEALGGGLTLVDAGAGPAGRHCGETDLTGGIFVGWSPLEDGIAGMAPLGWEDGAIVGAGVVLNPILVCHHTQKWIEFVMLHEMMHALGIAHSEVPESVMYDRAGCDRTAILRADDIAALKDHYPPSLEARRTEGGVKTTAAHPHGEMSVGVTDAAVAPEQLISRLAAVGCDARTLAITVGGRFYFYAVGAPSFVNAAFPSSLAARTTFLYRCAS